MIDALDRRPAWCDPARQDHLIVIHYIRRVYKLVEAQIHARQVDHSAVIAQGFVKFFFARDLFGDIELPANLSGGIE